MITSETHTLTPDLFQGKSQAVRDLFSVLLGELNQIGSIRTNSKEISISFENRKEFASAIIRNRSIKLILKATHKIDSPRILSIVRMAEKNYNHTILLESKADIDDELVKWLEDAYITSN
jgi:hypothetical protein